MDASTILIVGANGQLGLALQNKYPNARHADMQELDIASIQSVDNFDWNGVKVIINAAAYTNVDGAESTEGRVVAWKVNASGAGNLARIAVKHGIILVHISTDYVFDGTHDLHTEEEPLSPLGVYAQSKAAGDIAVSLVPHYYLLRTSWVIGEGKNFVRTMLDLGKRGIAPTVVNDQIGRLTFTSELVRAIDHLLVNQAAYGTYNITNGGDPASWADITREIFKDAGYDLTVSDTTTEAYFADKDGIAPRPLQSTLSLDKIQGVGFSPVDWHTDLLRYIEQEVKV